MPRGSTWRDYHRGKALLIARGQAQMNRSDLFRAEKGTTTTRFTPIDGWPSLGRERDGGGLSMSMCSIQRSFKGVLLVVVTVDLLPVCINQSIHMLPMSVGLYGCRCGGVSNGEARPLYPTSQWHTTGTCLPTGTHTYNTLVLVEEEVRSTTSWW